MLDKIAQKTKSAEPKSGLGKLFTRRRVPEILQMEATECGAACLAMVLSYYGRKTKVSEVRDYLGTGRDGHTAVGLVKAARYFGLRVRAISRQTADFRQVQLPAIIHWQFDHFVVVERWTAKYVDVVDPSGGRRRLNSEEFDLGFTGIVLLLEAGVHFAKDKKVEGSELTLTSYLKRSLQAPGIMVQILFTSILLQLFALTSPFLTQVLIDHIIPRKLDDLLVLLIIGMIILTVIQTSLSLLRSFLLMYLNARLSSQMTLSFFEHLLSLPYRFFQQRTVGDLINRISSNNAIRSLLSDQLIASIIDGGLLLIYLVLLVTVVPPLFVLIAVGFTLVQAIIMVVTNRPLVQLLKKQLASGGKTEGYLTEMLTGVATLKVSSAEGQAFERWSNLYFENLNLSTRQSYLTALFGSVSSLLQAFCPMLLMWVGTIQILEGKMTLGTVLAFNTIVLGFSAPLFSLVGNWQLLQSVRAHFERIADVLVAEPEQINCNLRQPTQLSGAIHLENISFRYSPEAPLVIHNINLSIQPGEKVAIVGRSGSGKSTLGKLILGLERPSTGEVYYDDFALSSLDVKGVRSQIGVVLQEAHIFSGSIRENITLVKPGLNLEAVIRAASLAGLAEDIAKMPMGYETYVAEGGSALSGGQRQRLALARAIAHSPSILLLDEASSHLDVVTEQLVAQNLQTLACTQIIIAHRLSTIRNADIILVMEEGQLVEWGRHEELLARQGYYAKLVQAQLRDTD
jgi:ATP-binding cassette, subfamily B, bacterial